MFPQRQEFKFHSTVDALFKQITKDNWEDVVNGAKKGVQCRFIGAHQHDRREVVESCHVVAGEPSCYFGSDPIAYQS